MAIQKAFVFNRTIYDGLKATTINGLKANQVEVFSSTYANDADEEAVFMPNHWDQLHDYDLVIWGEEEISLLENLPGSPRPGQFLVMIDGGDITKIRINEKVRPHLIFKRELFKKTFQEIREGIFPFNFAVEDLYWQEFTPHAQRKYDYSCMLRLASNPFREQLRDALLQIDANCSPKLSGFIGETGEIAYSPKTGFRLHTPKYFEILNQSRISLNCHGAGQDCYRFWEILGSGAMLLSQQLEIEISHSFKDGVHALFFSNLKEFEEKLQFSIHHPKEVEEIAMRGYQHAKEFHTVYQRGKFLLDKVDAYANSQKQATQLDAQYQHWQQIKKSNNFIYYRRKHLQRVKKILKKMF
jgi:Glycosyl transferases group 1